jgi:hypothetical protein
MPIVTRALVFNAARRRARRPFRTLRGRRRPPDPS